MKKETDVIWVFFMEILTSKICHHSMPVLTEKNIVTIKNKKNKAKTIKNKKQTPTLSKL